MKQNKKYASGQRSALYTLEGNPGLGMVLPFSLQQILAMFVTNMVPIGIIAAAASPALTEAEIFRLMQSAMIAAGIATILQATPIGKLGSGLPVFMGVSFTFVVPLSAIAAKYGYGAVTGTVLVGGLFEGLLGLTVRYWRRVMAPIVSAVVVTGIGLSLLSTAARSFGGGYAEDFGSVHNILIGFVTLQACLLWMVLAKGGKRQLSILVGLAAGYVAALLFGKVDLSGLTADGWVALPKLLPYRPFFRIDAIISIAIIYLVSATETLGDASALAGGGTPSWADTGGDDRCTDHRRFWLGSQRSSRRNPRDLLFRKCRSHHHDKCGKPKCGASGRHHHGHRRLLPACRPLLRNCAQAGDRRNTADGAGTDSCFRGGDDCRGRV